MPSSRYRALWETGFLLSLLGLGVWSLFALPGESRFLSKEIQREAQIKMEGVHLIETHEGKRILDIKAERALVSEKKGYARLSRNERPVNLWLYKGEDILFIRADEVGIDLETRDLSITGDVEARSNQGIELSTDALKWLAREEKLQSTRKVRILRQGLEITGLGLEADLNLDRLVVTSRVKSNFITLKGSGH